MGPEIVGDKGKSRTPFRGFYALTVFQKGAGGYVRAHGCRLTGKMTGGRPKIRLGPSAITLVESSVMALSRLFVTVHGGLYGVPTMAIDPPPASRAQRNVSIHVPHI